MLLWSILFKFGESGDLETADTISLNSKRELVVQEKFKSIIIKNAPFSKIFEVLQSPIGLIPKPLDHLGNFLGARKNQG